MARLVALQLSVLQQSKQVINLDAKGVRTQMEELPFTEVRRSLGNSVADYAMTVHVHTFDSISKSVFRSLSLSPPPSISISLYLYLSLSLSFSIYVSLSLPLSPSLMNNYLPGLYVIDLHKISVILYLGIVAA
jgi:hypothetical protein